MKKLSPEVLMYIQNVKNYFEINIEARDYFLNNSNEDLFYQHMTEIAQKNFEKNGEAILDKEQFELLRRTVIALTIASLNKSNKKIKIKEEDFHYNKDIFVSFPNFGFICLN